VGVLYITMGNKLVLDLETQKTFQDVGGQRNLAHLLISVCGVYNYDTKELRAYREEELDKLEEVLKTTETIIGFNHISFDMPVLKPYLKQVRLDDFKYIDIMLVLQEVLGYRVSLDSVAGATLGTKKSGHGLQAIEFYRKGMWDELIKYCLDDVDITRKVYEFGLKNGYVKFKAGWGSYEVPVDFS
jgi:DEAD/DEAH box helicase domain-containing protein